jgi:hypothetical protein
MKLSNKTINYLKHFATISPNFLFRQGNKQSAISPIKDRVAMATFDTSFPATFPLGNLGGFLKVVSSFKNPDLKFTKTRLTISDESGHYKRSNFFHNKIIKKPFFLHNLSQWERKEY